MNTKTKKDDRKRVELCDWNEAVPVDIKSSSDHYSAKAKRKGTKTEYDLANAVGIRPDQVATLLANIGKCVSDGYEVNLCGAVRFYACVEKLKTPYIASQTLNDFRKSIAGKSIRPVWKGKEVPISKVVAANEAKKREYANRINVTPDTVVTCPQCGTEFRVGKILK